MILSVCEGATVIGKKQIANKLKINFCFSLKSPDIENATIYPKTDQNHLSWTWESLTQRCSKKQLKEDKSNYGSLFHTISYTETLRIVPTDTQTGMRTSMQLLQSSCEGL